MIIAQIRCAQTALGLVAQWLRCWTVVQEVQGLIPALGKNFFSLFHMDTEEIELIKNQRPIGHGPLFQRRSIGPLPSCLTPYPLVSANSRNLLS